MSNPKLILLPGMDGTGILFRAFMECADGYDIEVITYPSDVNTEYVELENIVLHQLPLDREFVLLAESFAGPLAYRLVARELSNLKAVFFIASFIQNPRPWLLSFVRVLPISLLLSFPLPMFFIRQFLYAEQANHEQIAEFKEALRKVSPTVFAHRLRQLARLPAADKLIETPCCYISAEKDRLLPKSVVEPFTRIFHKIKIRAVNGPHFLMQTQPKQCFNIIHEEIQQLLM